MESLKKVVEFLMKLLVKLPINCIKYIKDLIKTCLENIVSIFKNKEKIIEIKEKDTVRENNIEEEKYNNQSVEESKKIEEKESVGGNSNNQQEGEISVYIQGGEPKNDSEQKEKVETKENVEMIKKKEEENKKEQTSKEAQLMVEPGIVIETDSSIITNPIPPIELPKFIKPEPILPKILFEDIDKNEEVFSRIFQELEKVKESLSLPEMDQKIFMKRIENLEKELKKYRTRLEKEIEEEEIEEDEYSETVSNKFIKILNENYKIVIENILKNIEYKGDKCYKEAFQIFESFLLNLDFRKGDYQIKNIRNNDTDYFEVIGIRTEKEEDDGKVKEITRQPYILNYKDNCGEEKEKYILGQLIYYKYGRLN